MASYLSSLVDFFTRSCSLTRAPAAVVTKKSSTVVVHTGNHLFKVVGHSKLAGSQACLTSETFRIGGHNWAILYYPNGNGRITNGQFSSVFLKLVSTTDSEVTTSVSFCLQDLASPSKDEKNKTSFGGNFSPSETTWGKIKFVSKTDLAASGCLQNDCLVIKCTIAIHDYVDDDDCIEVPPSDLSKDLRNLHERGFKADLTVRVGSIKSFEVHGCMLAARSPVFRAQLCGPMKESRQTRIDIDDMDPGVFEVLLHYIYNDCLPDFMDGDTEEATHMAQHLLVAADRYAVERLKLICESKLSKALEVNTVGLILDLAEQYHCHHLKAHGLKYIETNKKSLGEIGKTEGFMQLKHNHPLLAQDILAMAPQREKKKRKRNRNKGRNKKSQ